MDSATTQPKKQIHVPVSSVVKELKGAKCRLVITLKDSADDRIARSGFKQEQEEIVSKTLVDQAESMLHLRVIIGNRSTGRQGEGMSHFQQLSKASGLWFRHTQENQQKLRANRRPG